jgi:hypothetical protein
VARRVGAVCGDRVVLVFHVEHAIQAAGLVDEGHGARVVVRGLAPSETIGLSGNGELTLKSLLGARYTPSLNRP